VDTQSGAIGPNVTSLAAVVDDSDHVLVQIQFLSSVDEIATVMDPTFKRIRVTQDLVLVSRAGRLI
jgi:hypothetical protein